MKKQTTIISFANHKGGVGKTTTTSSVGSILASKGNKVLVIDLDAQANLTTSLMSEEPEESIYYSLRSDKALPVINIRENLDLVPSSLQLALVELEIGGQMSREYILKNLIDPIKDRYDYILIDCPPSLGLLTLNALVASTDVVIPLRPEVLPFKGLSMITQFIDNIRVKLHSSIRIAGILITFWRDRVLCKQIETGLRCNDSIFTFQTKIRDNISVAEAPLNHIPVQDYLPKCNGSVDYLAFVEELTEKLGRNVKK